MFWPEKCPVSIYMCKDTSGDGEKRGLDGGGADPSGILVKRIRQKNTGSKESNTVNEEVVT